MDERTKTLINLLDWINIQLITNPEFNQNKHYDTAYDLIKMANIELTKTINEEQK